MRLTEDERNAIVLLRLDNAKQTLEDARIIATNKLWKAAANRLYYACYYAASALLIKSGFEAKTHAGIIRLLGLNFISKNIINNELGDMYYKLFALRQKSDYDDWITINESDIIPLVEPAKQFIQTIEQLILKTDGM
jgi:uncharacterized protein (UPF0332 family)